jgi:hypothetical protein
LETTLKEINEKDETYEREIKELKEEMTLVSDERKTFKRELEQKTFSLDEKTKQHESFRHAQNDKIKEVLG